MNLNDQTKEDIERAFKALDVLEEIREEIKELRDFYFVNFQGYSMTVAQKCLDIIDKHMKEVKE